MVKFRLCQVVDLKIADPFKALFIPECLFCIHYNDLPYGIGLFLQHF